MDAYCDYNTNGFIDPWEKTVGNRVWDFGDAGEAPAIRCTAFVEGGLETGGC